MIYYDINCFLSILTYPISEPEMIFDNPLEKFYEKHSQMIEQQMCLGNWKPIFEKREKLRGQVREQVLKLLKNKSNIYSYDKVYQYLEKWYLGDSIYKDIFFSEIKGDKINYNEFDIIMNILMSLSNSLISKLDNQIVYKYWENEKDKNFLGGFLGSGKIHLFRSLNQTIPLDILVVLFALKSENREKELEGFFGNVAVTDLLLEDVVKSGVAENHLHMGVTVSFSAIWDNLMMSIEKGESKTLFSRFGSFYLLNKEELYFYLCLARCIRNYMIILTYAFQEGKLDKAEEFFKDKTLNPIHILNEKEIKKLKTMLFNNNNNVMDRIEQYFMSIQNEIHMQIQDIEKNYIPEEICSVNTTWENKILFYVLKFIYGTRKDSNIEVKCYLIKKLFLHYLRIKNYFFQVIVQNKQIFGLDYFQTYYGRVSSWNRELAKKQYTYDKEYQQYYQILKTQFSIKNLNKLELRTSFPDTEGEGRKQIKKFLQAYLDLLHENYCKFNDGRYYPYKKFPRLGLVFHFIKTEQFENLQCFQLEEREYLQYGSLYNKYKNQLSIFKRLRDTARFPGIDKYLVGIDIASLENVVPTWVFSNLFENARDGHQEPLYHNKYMEPFQSLGFTCHVGEDFRHLLSGVRRIYEVIHYMKFHVGDRIGHGLALGMDPYEWNKRNPNVILPRIEVIENYVWAYKILSEFKNDLQFSNFQFLKYRIHELSKEIYENNFENITIENWIDAYELLFKQEQINYSEINKNNCNYCDNCSKYNIINDEVSKSNFKCYILDNEKSKNKGMMQVPYQILQSYHCLKFITKMKEPIHYKITQQELEILISVQKIVKELVAKEGIVVEVNPNSNVTIGDIDTLKEHPMYNISIPKCDYENVLICVNSDDPGVFHTNVINEIGFAYFGMLEQGICRETCLDWIEKLCKTSMRCSFIRRNDTDEQLLNGLEELISTL